MAGENKGNKIYRPAWRSFFYPDILLMIIIFVVACIIGWKVNMGGKGWILALIVLIAFVVLFMRMFIKRISSYLIVRRDEVAFERGILNRKSTEIGYEDIRTVDVTQTLIQRIFNLGHISIASSGTGGYEIFAKNMPNPNEIRDEIQGRKRAMIPNKSDPEAVQAEEMVNRD